MISSQSLGLASSELTVISLNDLLNTETGTLTNKFGFSGTTVAIITTTDNKTFLAIDINGWGSFDSDSMLIDVTNSTLTSLNASTFVGISFYGTTAHDSITGSDFDDYIYGELGNDTLVGNAGNDEIFGGDGSDSILGGMGDDTLSGELGDDYISGDDGNDYLYDFQGNNTLLGGLGNDNIFGGIGNDSLLGGEGDDSIDAGDGNDTILGGIGNNVLTGGTGNDSFIFAASSVAPSITNFDVINDFGLDLDVIDFIDTITIALATAPAIVGTAQVSSNGVANFAAADDTLAERLVAVEQAIQLNSLTAGEAAIFVSGYDSYIFISDATAGVGVGDVLIKLNNIVATSLTLNAGNIVAVTSPYSIADFSNLVSGILAEDTIYILDTASNVSTNFDSLIIPNLAKIDRIDISNSTVLPLLIAQFMTTGVVNVLRENSVSIDATDATLSEIAFFYTHIGKIAPNGLSNLALSTANQLEYEIYDLLSKSSNATVVAASPTDYEINSFAKFAANIATNGITGSYTLNDWNAANAAEAASLLSKTSAAATVVVDASYMSSTKLIAISANIGKVDSITNLSINTSDFTDTETANLLNVATSNVFVNSTGATADEVASIISNINKIPVAGISGGISLTTAQALTLGSKLSPYIAITLTDTTSATAADLLAIDALTVGGINANTITTITGTSIEINSVLQSYSTINLNGVTTLILTDASNASLITTDVNVSSGQLLVIDGSTASGFNFNGAAETDGKFSVVGGAGADSIIGGYGADTLLGGAGADSIVGGYGADTLFGGAGIDTMTGGEGVDIFAFDTPDLDTTAGSVTDVIVDFISGTDKISLATAGNSGNFYSHSTPFGTVSNMLTAADAVLDGTIKYYFGIVNNGSNSDSYLITDVNGIGYTDVIKFVGAATVVAADIIATA